MLKYLNIHVLKYFFVNLIVSMFFIGLLDLWILLPSSFLDWYPAEFCQKEGHLHRYHLLGLQGNDQWKSFLPLLVFITLMIVKKNNSMCLLIKVFTEKGKNDLIKWKFSFVSLKKQKCIMYLVEIVKLFNYVLKVFRCDTSKKKNFIFITFLTL